MRHFTQHKITEVPENTDTLIAVIPDSSIIIPRKQSTGTVLKVSSLMRKELAIDAAKEKLKIDNQAVLRYIRSNSKKFEVLLANRDKDC